MELVEAAAVEEAGRYCYCDGALLRVHVRQGTRLPHDALLRVHVRQVPWLPHDVRLRVRV